MRNRAKAAGGRDRLSAAFFYKQPTSLFCLVENNFVRDVPNMFLVPNGRTVTTNRKTI